MRDTVSEVPGENDNDDGRTGDRLTRRLGRNLPAAAGVGITLAAVVVATLFILKEVFVGLVVLLVGMAVTELQGALRPSGVRLTFVPLLAGLLGMLLGGYFGGPLVLVAALGLTTLLICFWRLSGGRSGYVRDITASVFVALYVPFLAAFALLLLKPEDGAARVLVFVAVTVASDLGGYAAGVLFGRHKLVPTISPGKTWEGLAGSTFACLAVGVAGVLLLLDGAWWAGAALGLVVTVTATLGDLVESMLKRDLDLKDMGSLLPGHGGVMDRLDSLLPSALAAWLVLTFLVPPA